MSHGNGQPRGRMTIMAPPEHDWETPLEIEVRIGGELAIYGMTTGVSLQHIERSCANPDCDNHCVPTESLGLEIEIAPDQDLGVAT